MTDELKQWEYDKGYTKGYSDGRASLIEELEKIKAEIKREMNNPVELAKNRALYWVLEILDKHISELKGENK